jgi:DNA-binding NtrC family response regulator
LRKVLVVDDNIALAENIAEILSDADVGEAVVVNSGQRALDLIERHRFDTMITDMRMPGMSGAQLIQRARQVDPELPVVVLTAFIGDNDLSVAMQEGLLTVLGKPVPMQSLLGLIMRARRGRPVLIVEDEVAMADNVVELLRGRGFATLTAHSLPELERVAGSPSVALVDLRIAGADDGASLRRVAERFPATSIVVMTGLRTEVATPPTVPVIDKPFDSSRLLALVEQLFVDKPTA